MDKQAIMKRIAELGLLAVLRAPDSAGARRAVDALVEAGVLGIKITYSTPDAATVIADVKQSYGDEVLVGAGNQRARAQVAQAAGAGASYLVSPGLDDEVVASMRVTSLPAMAGILTPTEIMRGVRLGVDVMKLFLGSLGGPSYLRSLRGPFPNVPFMPTGGISADNVGDWLSAGAIAVGAGSERASVADISSGDFAGIREKGRRFLAAIRKARADAAPRASR